jgi:SurA N-terminal domain
MESSSFRVSALVVVALIVAACGARTAPETSNEPVAAEVGADVVTVQEVEALLAEAQRIFRKRGRVFPAESDPYYADLRDEAVRYLVERSLREQLAEELGINVADSQRRDSLELDTYLAIAKRRDDGETVREALARYRRVLEDDFATVKYAPGYTPAVHRRAIPPELRRLPKPKAKCDLKTGMYPYLVARAHGCLGAGDVDLTYIAPPCPEIPAGLSDPGFTEAELDSGYADYTMSGTAQHDFFEPLTTNAEDLASEENPEGPECQGFPSSLVSVGDVGFRSMPAP